MVLRLFVLFALVASIALPVSVSAQATPEASPVAAGQAHFFAGAAGNGGGARIVLTSTSLLPDELLVVSASVTQFDSEPNASAAFDTAAGGYDAWLEGQIDPAFDFATVNRAKNVPEIGDDTLLFRGNAKSRTESASSFATAIFVVRSGSTILEVTGISVTGDAVALTSSLAESILAKSPTAASVPVDGSAADADIWAWLPSPDDEALGGFTVAEQVWFDASGTEFAAGE